MEETLKKVHGFSRAMYIISKIVFISCIVGLCMCASAIVWGLATGSMTGTVIWGSIEIHSILQVSDGENLADIWGGLAYDVLSLAFTMSIARIAMRLFSNMRNENTPFIIENADLLKRMGIILIVASVVPQIVGASVGASLAAANDLQYSSDINNGFSLIAALSFFAMSVIFKYGCVLQTEVDETL